MRLHRECCHIILINNMYFKEECQELQMNKNPYPFFSLSWNSIPSNMLLNLRLELRTDILIARTELWKWIIEVFTSLCTLQ